MTAAVKLGLQSSWGAGLVAGGVHWDYGMARIVGCQGSKGVWLLGGLRSLVCGFVSVCVHALVLCAFVVLGSGLVDLAPVVLV